MPAEMTISDWEGLLFPDTYEFSQDAEPSSILQRLASTMEQRVDSIDWSIIEAAGYTPYQGVIIASLIETDSSGLPSAFRNVRLVLIPLW